MKIAAARIRNFKLLRNIDLSFSTDRERPLTVIRAENGSGKTSTLQALRWALYGKNVLEDPLVRLSPADWPDGEPCSVSVEIDFIHSYVSNVGTEMIDSEVSYVLKREVREVPEGDRPNREQENITLYEITSGGTKPINGAESYLGRMLPKEMIDIFFTDGDAAMTFISSDLSDSTRQDKVKDAIRSLLGLELLNQVQDHISGAKSSINRQIKRIAGSDRLSTVTEEVESKQEEKKNHEEKIALLNDQIQDIDRKLHKVQRDLIRALQNGSYEELAKQRNRHETQLTTALDEENDLKHKHQELFIRESLSWKLINDSLQKGFGLLQNLHDQGVIPKAAVPVLKERLELGRCICGEELTEGSDAHKHVSNLIEQQQEQDDQVDYLSTLYYQARVEFEKWGSDDARQWKDESRGLQKTRLSLRQRLDTINHELESVNARLDQIDEEEIERKRSRERALQSALQQKNNDLTREKISLDGVEEALGELLLEQKELSRVDERMSGLNAEKAALDDLEYVVSGTLEEMQSTYLRRVSTRMNELFLDMIGADPNQGAIYQGAEINDQYNIIVRTMDNRTLNQDFEVNGASKRALTFAFVWALTEISSVVAPRVIDTPLGAMSGSVKKRVLEIVSRPAGDDVDRQVILFLTQSEISHTEDILDERVGSVMTLTKTDDFPADLVHNPKVDLPEILLCTCSHRQFCDQCQRNNHEIFNLGYRAT